MLRAFDYNEKRSVRSLDGEWYFITDKENVGEGIGYPSAIPEKATRTFVPSVWNTTLGLLEYEGAAWYFRKFRTDGRRTVLHFGAVMTAATVWIDGILCGSHYGGFSSFNIELPTLGAGEHLLTVRADNSFDSAAIPAKMVDWYHYGGIPRSVELWNADGICIRYSHAYYDLSQENKTASIRFKIKLKNYGTAKTDTVTVKLNGETLLTTPVTLAEGEEQEIETSSVTVNGIDIWSPASPTLYTLDTETETDGLRDRIGFREIAIKASKIYLNGEELTVKGVCRHEEHPDYGFAFPPALMERDIDIIKNMNANAIRGSHYPNSQYFVDLLDERGMLFWSEIPIWGVGYTAEMLGVPLFVERAHKMILEMAEQYHNHPSIIIWGIHNEIPSQSENAKALSKVLYTALKERADGRIVTYACNHPFDDICMEYCDVICLNQYHGWYGGGIESWAKHIEDFKARRAELGMQDKPIIYSEFGAAAIYGHHTFDDIKWTEEYQARLISHAIKLFMEDEAIAGCYVWQYCDIRTCAEMGLNRARGFNNKGLVNEYRRPKMAYNAVKTLYSEN